MSEEKTTKGQFPFENAPDIQNEFQEEHNKTQEMIDVEKMQNEREEKIDEELDELRLDYNPPNQSYNSVSMSTYGIVEETKSTYNAKDKSEKYHALEKENKDEIRDSGIKSGISLKSDFDHAQEGEIE